MECVVGRRPILNPAVSKRPSPMPDKKRRSPARLLAPLALVAFAVALLVVLGGGGGGKGDDGGSDAGAGSDEPVATDTATETAPKADARPRKRTYTVAAGDNLDVISEKTGVPTETLEELNPELDPFALDIGQKITLRE